MRKTRLIVGLCGVTMLTLAGCSSGSEAGPATSTQSPDGGQSNVGPPSTTPSLPSVENALDVSKLAADPCSGLTATQLEPYAGAIRGSRKSDRRNGPICSLFSVDGNRIGVAIFVFPDIGGPAGIKNGIFPYKKDAGFIADYPAVHQAQDDNGPQDGECETLVAVSDRAAIAVYLTSTNKSDPYFSNMCAASDKLAELAIANLKAGG